MISQYIIISYILGGMYAGFVWRDLDYGPEMGTIMMVLVSPIS